MNPPAETPPIPVALALSPDFEPAQITVEKLDLTAISEETKLAYLLRNVFTPEECAALIKISEATGYAPAPVHIGGGKEILMKGYRDGGRVLIDDRGFVDLLLQRLWNFLPKTFMGEEIVEINERLRFLRYDSTDQFKRHYDASFRRSDDTAASRITLQMYLNEGFEGGETTFLACRSRNRIPIVPETGMILVFQHNILHEGSIVKSGRKYSLRTDVMYTMNCEESKEHIKWIPAPEEAAPF